MARNRRKGLGEPWGRAARVAVEALEPRRLLAVDLDYSSFLGGGAYDFPYFVHNLPSGDMILVGVTASNDFTTTAGLDATFGGGINDAFVARLHKSGTLMWSTLLGGDGEEKPKHIALDPAGNLILSGSTKSTDFAATEGLDQEYGGGWDGFVTRLDPETGAVIWSTYLGGFGDEFVTALPSILGDWYIAGNTGSADFPVSNGFDDSYGGGDRALDITSGDVFVGRIDLNGQVLSASFVGGNGYDIIFSSFGLDPQGNLYVPVTMDSTDVVAEGGFSSPNAGASDGYVVKVAPSGALAWSARIGGSGDENLTHMSVDDSGNLQIAGITTSTNWPATTGMDTTFGGVTDVYLTVLDTSDGSQRWGTYIGGNGNEFPHQFFPEDGSIYGLIEVSSTDLPASGGYDLSNPTGGDRMVVKYTMEGELDWSTYLGGEGTVGFGLIRANGDGSLYFVGAAGTNFSAVGGFDTTPGGVDGAVVRISAEGQREWSTFVGGGNTERQPFFDEWLGVEYGFAGQDPPAPNDIIVYVTTDSDDFETVDGFDSTFNGQSGQFGGGGDVLLVHLASDGAHNASSYLGGSGIDSLDIWQRDEDGGIVLVGTSDSADFPVTADASDGSYNGGPAGLGDLVISRLSFGQREVEGQPIIDSFTDGPDPVPVNGIMTLSASANDADGSVASISFYLESNGIAGLQAGVGGAGDTLLLADSTSPYAATVNTGALGQVAGDSYVYYAVATDDKGGTSMVVSTINSIAGVNQPPTISAFVDSPDPVAVNGQVTLSAAASDPNGLVASVSFYAESNGVEGLQINGDLLLFVDTMGPYRFAVDTSTLNQTAGSTYTYYAFATDNRGATSAVLSTTSTPQVPGPLLVLSSLDLTFPSAFFYFDRAINPASVSANELLITNLDTGVTTTNALSASVSGQSIFFFLPRDLPDGKYRFRLPAGAVAGQDGAATLSDAVIVGPTVFFLAGDVNRDGKVSTADYLRMDRGMARGKRTFMDGDLNYDRMIDAADYFIIDQAFLAQMGPADGAGAPAAILTPVEQQRDEEEDESGVLTGSVPAVWS